MKYNILLLLFLSILSFSSQKSQDYSRHLELSLLFYECQRSGRLPPNNRIYFRHDSMLDAGKDVGLDLSGGYYDAGDNCKFNYPGAGSITLIAWSAIDFADGYKKAGQINYVKEMVKWGTDYFIKCHPNKNELYVAVGDGLLDHSYWYPPEYMNYDYPSYKIDTEHPGSDIAGEISATFAAASILFKDDDINYSNILLQHAIDLYDFADTYRGDYCTSVPLMKYFYGVNEDGYYDELAWGALWLYRATGNEKYKQKFLDIKNNRKDYDSFELSMNWGDKYPGVYILAAQLFKTSEYMDQAYKYCQKILDQKRTPGGLYFDLLSQWGSNRHASNAASTLAFFSRILDETDSKKKEYIDFIRSQINYILGDNPKGINYVVGAEENSPKSVHHRGASYTYDNNGNPSINVYTLYGALAGGPSEDDDYTDDRSDYQRNEVALDYNAGFTVCLSALVYYGYGKKDPKSMLNFSRSWPKKAPIPDIRVEMTKNSIKVSTGSEMICGQFCIFFYTDRKIAKFSDKSYQINGEGPYYILCNGLENGFLDGNGTPQTFTFRLQNSTDFIPPNEFNVLCDGYYHRRSGEENVFKPEYGHLYHIIDNGGIGKTFPLFNESECWPSFICENKEKLPIENEWNDSYQKANDFIDKLSLTEKISLLYGTENLYYDYSSNNQRYQCIGQINSFSNEYIDFNGMCSQDGTTGVRNVKGTSISWQSPLNTVSTFNKELMYKIGKAQGEEYKEKGINAFLTPCVNILRSPQAGRSWEAFGDDPYLSGIAAEQIVKGIQENGVIAVIKHFVANDQESYRHASSSNVDMQTLMDIYVEPFYRSIKNAKLGSVMAAYSAVNGIYCYENKFILTDILRNILDFKGFVVSDWWAIVSDHPASMNSGCDLNMPGGKSFGKNYVGKDKSFWSSFEQYVKDGKITSDRITEAATRIIATMYQLNQMDEFPKKDLYFDTKTEEKKLLQRKAAIESQILLKNDGILPLKKDYNTFTLSKLAIIGNSAFPRDCINGDGDLQCRNATNLVMNGHIPTGYGSGTTNYDYLITPLEGITKIAENKGIEIISSGKLIYDVVNGVNIKGTEDYETAQKIAIEADICIVYVAADSGEEYLQVENTIGDRPNLDLWHGGDELIEKVVSVNKNVIVIINAPSVVNIPWLDKVRAVIYSGFPGAESGNAIANVLFGIDNFSGHLPFVWGKLENYPTKIELENLNIVEGTGKTWRDIYRYKGVDSFGLQDDEPGHEMEQLNYTEGLYVGQRWFNKNNIKPIFPFGYGLTYSKFEYSDIKAKMTKEGLTVTFYISNESDIDGKAVPMLFITFPDSIGDYPPYIFKGFEKININAGSITKATLFADDHALSYFNVDENKYVRVKEGIIKYYIAENGDPLQTLLQGEIDAAY